MKTFLLCDAFARKCLQLRYHGQQSGTFDHLMLAKTLCQRLVSTLFGGTLTVERLSTHWLNYRESKNSTLRLLELLDSEQPGLNG